MPSQERYRTRRLRGTTLSAIARAKSYIDVILPVPASWVTTGFPWSRRNDPATRVGRSPILSGMSDPISPLRALLAAGEWKAADLETRRLLIAGADTGGYVGLDADEAARVECDLLRSIDAAWADASGGRFGFAAQAHALSDARSAELPPADTWRAFGRSVGWVDGREWIEEDGLVYDIAAPPGHLPWLPGSGTVVNTGRVYEGFFQFYARFAACSD